MKSKFNSLLVVAALLVLIGIIPTTRALLLIGYAWISEKYEESRPTAGDDAYLLTYKQNQDFLKKLALAIEDECIFDNSGKIIPKFEHLVAAANIATIVPGIENVDPLRGAGRSCNYGFIRILKWTSGPKSLYVTRKYCVEKRFVYIPGRQIEIFGNEVRIKDHAGRVVKTIPVEKSLDDFSMLENRNKHTGASCFFRNMDGQWFLELCVSRKGKTII